jgi:small subunit ribosomal protein S6
MPEQTPTYDLMLLLSQESPEEERTRILSEVEGAISSAGGSVERRDDWGTRALTFRIDHQAEADYHLLQFSGPPSLLELLSRDLRIADAVLRFRIIKVIAGTPAAPEHPPPVIAAVSSGRPDPGPHEPAAAEAEE